MKLALFLDNQHSSLLCARIDKACVKDRNILVHVLPHSKIIQFTLAASISLYAQRQAATQNTATVVRVGNIHLKSSEAFKLRIARFSIAPSHLDLSFEGIDAENWKPASGNQVIAGSRSRCH